MATLSKEVALVVPPLLVAADGLCPPPRAPREPAARWRRALRRALPYFGISLAYFASRLPALLAIAEGRLTAGDLWTRLSGALESLALAYRKAIGQVEQALGYPLEAVHIVGGGSQNRLLNQFTADATGKPVIAGPVEATAIGNSCWCRP